MANENDKIRRTGRVNIAFDAILSELYGVGSLELISKIERMKVKTALELMSGPNGELEAKLAEEKERGQKTIENIIYIDGDPGKGLKAETIMLTEEDLAKIYIYEQGGAVLNMAAYPHSNDNKYIDVMHPDGREIMLVTQCVEGKISYYFQFKK